LFTVRLNDLFTFESRPRHLISLKFECYNSRPFSRIPFSCGLIWRPCRDGDETEDQSQKTPKIPPLLLIKLRTHIPESSTRGLQNQAQGLFPVSIHSRRFQKILEYALRGSHTQIHGVHFPSRSYEKVRSEVSNPSRQGQQLRVIYLTPRTMTSRTTLLDQRNKRPFLRTTNPPGRPYFNISTHFLCTKQ
jgi:hypothetical protein